MAHYIKASNVKKVFNEKGKQLTKDGLFAIDVKIGEFLEKACRQFNGHHKRITAELINLIRLSIMILFIFGCAPAYAETWVATAYCPCQICCGKTDGITACGIKAKQGITCAVNWLPFGTVLIINGESYIVEDRGAKSIFGTKANPKKRVDIYMTSHAEARRFGKREVEVEICSQ